MTHFLLGGFFNSVIDLNARLARIRCAIYMSKLDNKGLPNKDGKLFMSGHFIASLKLHNKPRAGISTEFLKI